MKLANSSRQQLEMFFRDHLNDESFRLPVIYFYNGKFTKLLTNLISVHGITFGKRIFIAPRLVSLNQKKLPKLPESLAAHEITHVLQYRQEGFVKFFYKYLRDFCRNLKKKEKWDSDSQQQAYLEIPFEIEAREAAACFIEWKKNRNEK